MPKLKNRAPKQCRDGNQSFSWHNGKRYYHGTFGTSEAEENYRRFKIALLENPTLLPVQGNKVGDVLVSELATGFLTHIEPRTNKTDLWHFKRAIGFLAELYGGLPVNEFSPKKLMLVRSQMVRTGTLCRKTINKYIVKIRRIFKWGVVEEVVPPSVILALKAVEGLQKGEPETFDHASREDVPDAVIKRTLPFMSPTVAAMVQVQRLTGMRPSEVCRMAAGNIDRTRDPKLWYYVPEKHKTEEYIGKKAIPLGEPERELIAPYLEGKKPTEAVFSPRTAMQELNTERRTNRKTKISPSQQERDRQTAENPADRLGEFYDRDSYRKAVEYAIRKGNGVLPVEETIPDWTPYQLRHTAATETSRAVGKEKAKALLTHRSMRTIEIYDHSDLAVREELARNRQEHNPFANEPTEVNEP